MKLALSPYQVIHRQEWYRVVTHGFVHADMTHLLVNMFTFWSFGIRRTWKVGLSSFVFWRNDLCILL